MKILIAEDNTIFRKILQKTPEKWGYEVLTVVDGLEARDRLCEWRNLILPERDSSIPRSLS